MGEGINWLICSDAATDSEAGGSQLDIDMHLDNDLNAIIGAFDLDYSASTSLSLSLSPHTHTQTQEHRQAHMYTSFICMKSLLVSRLKCRGKGNVGL